MNAVIITGMVVSDLSRSVTASGTPKLEFSLESESRLAPLRFKCLAFGKQSEIDITLGNNLAVNGRLEATLHKGKAAGFVLIMHSVEKIL